MIKIEDSYTEEFYAGPDTKFSHPDITKLVYHGYKNGDLGWGYFCIRQEHFVPHVPYVLPNLFAFRTQKSVDSFFLDIPVVEIYEKKYRKYDDIFIYFFQEI